jgi:hypothetical protein
MSCQPCGCDPTYKEKGKEVGYLCETHQNQTVNARLVGGVGQMLGSTESHSMTEIRIIDPKTGGQKGQKEERFDLIPNEFERALALHYGKGARKYDDRNWERGYNWSLSVGALRRHLAAWLDGESCDVETGSNHLIAVAWHAVALFVFQTRGLGTDDITKKAPR